MRSVPAKGFVGQVGAHRRGHVIKPVGLLHNGTFTFPSPPHQRNPICLLFIPHITVWGCCLGWYHLCVFLYEYNFEKAEMNLKKLSQPDRVFSASFLILLVLFQNPLHNQASKTVVDGISIFEKAFNLMIQNPCPCSGATS